MNKAIYLAIAAAVVIIIVIVANNFYQTRQAKTGSHPNSPTVTALPTKPSQPTLALVNIYGFGCPTCPTIAENALKDKKGVLDAKVTSSGEGSRVLYDASIISVEEIKKDFPYTIDVVSQEASSNSKLN